LTACGGGGSAVPGLQVPAVTSAQGVQQSDASGAAPARALSAASAIAAPQASNVAVAIDAGGGATGGWIGDADYSGGSTASVSGSANTGNVPDPAPQAVYQSQRYGSSFAYRIPNLAPNSAYSVQLHFVESFWTSTGKRLFNVSINGSRVLTNFDIFASAGGADMAVVKSFGSTADSSGTITIQLSATRDNASIAGIAVLGQSGSATPAPAPGGGGDSLPWVYSELWSGSSPFRTTVSALKSRGASAVSHSYMDALWSQGVAGNVTAGGIPAYAAKAGDPVLTTICTMYGGNCNARNVRIHVPSYAKPQQESDGHLTVVDQNAPGGPIEIDCWQASMYGSTFQCSWAGVFSLGSTGVATGRGSGIHGGMAVTTILTTAQEMNNGHIDHALAMDTRCLNSPDLFPSDPGGNTDASCNGSSSPPHYGNLMHLLWSSSQIQGSSYSAPCKVVLTALATYGAYLSDTGDEGLQIHVNNELSYTANPAAADQDPWPGIQSKINAAGDGFSNRWYSCLQRLSSQDFELLEIAQ
jgi:hypothetical protein